MRTIVAEGEEGDEDRRESRGTSVGGRGLCCRGLVLLLQYVGDDDCLTYLFDKVETIGSV